MQNRENRKPAKFEDKLTVHTEIIKKSAVRLNLLQKVKTRKELLVLAEVELAMINKKGEISKLPISFLNKLK